MEKFFYIIGIVECIITNLETFEMTTVKLKVIEAKDLMKIYNDSDLKLVYLRYENESDRISKF